MLRHIFWIKITNFDFLEQILSGYFLKLKQVEEFQSEISKTAPQELLEDHLVSSSHDIIMSRKTLDWQLTVTKFVLPTQFTNIK